MKRTTVLFVRPRQVRVLQEAMPHPGKGEVRVRARVSAISPGSELLVYREQFPAELPLDAAIPALASKFAYPLKYGYAVVGRVDAVGAGVAQSWLNRPVFCFHPHESHFLANPGQLIPLPSEMEPEQAVFLAGMESAVNLVMDGQPVIGERAAVFGQGIIGLLTCALLAHFPLQLIVTLDRYKLRRRASLQAGAHTSLDPRRPAGREELQKLLQTRAPDGGADLVYEISGNPMALDQAIAAAGFGSRVVVGSWYGTRPVRLDLGGKFHRSRVQLISSQVSTLAPGFRGRWTKSRRLELALEMIRRIRPGRFITHRFSIQQAPQAYQLLDRRPGQCLQVIFTYDD